MIGEPLKFQVSARSIAAFALRACSASSSSWALCTFCVCFFLVGCNGKDLSLDLHQPQPAEVVFWHFWGGEDRAVVEKIVGNFNDSQNRYFVRAIAMPGNNLQAKLFLAVAGGDPPDIVNQDDPVLADWAKRGVIQPLNDVATANDVNSVAQALLPPARRLSLVDGRLYGVCNGLDIRALLYNKTAIDNAGLEAPQTIAQLDAIAEHFSPSESGGVAKRLQSPVGYLPDSRRLWAWGPVFGADFYDQESARLTLDCPPMTAALRWMAGYGRRYGADSLAAFRQGDQSLPGKTFPLLPVDDNSLIGRYVVMMDGQWRVRDISAFAKRRANLGLPEVTFGVCPLPFVDVDDDGRPDSPTRKNAGWVNGNFFVVPAGARCSAGAWAFAKFWIGQSEFGGANEAERAASWYAEGGWVPATRNVAQSETYKNYRAENPLMETFVRLASSPHQYPIPVVVGAAMLKRAVENLTYDALMTDDDEIDVGRLLKRRNVELNGQLDTLREATF